MNQTLAATTQTDRAINFWQGINANLPSAEIESWIETLESGKGDWFRNYGLLHITIARYCRIGRIGYDQDKHDKLVAWAERRLEANGISAANMQN